MNPHMTLKGRNLSDEETTEIARVVRKNLPLRGSKISTVTTADLRAAFAYSDNPTPHKGSGKRGEMRGSLK